MVKETLDLITEITKKLGQNHIELLLNEIKNLTTADDMMLDFIKNFYISSHINVAMRSTTAHSKKKASAEIIAKWDLDLFWNSIQDEN